MKIRITANAGILLNISNAVFLIDGLHNERTVPFCTTPTALLNRIIFGQEEFSHINALLFTHTHKDHYDKECVNLFLQNHNKTAVICPSLDEKIIKKKIYQISCVTIEAYELPHEGDEFNNVTHYGYYIYNDSESIFISGDAALNAEPLLAFLNGRKPKAAVLSFPFITLNKGRQIVEMIDPEVLIAYHLPFEGSDPNRYIESCKRAVNINNFNRRVEILYQPDQQIEI